jgi:fructose-1,6-bisphosphatase/inositol monophosphatase family enzyme
MDYQTGIVGIVEDDKTNYYQIQTSERVFFDNPTHDSIEDSWIVVTLENREERRHLNRLSGVLEKSKRIIIGSGHIYWLKLATGFVDGYLDPIGGEPLYEMFAATVAQKAGCVVTDVTGRPFDAVGSLVEFEKSQRNMYYPVAARTLKLHNKLLKNFF